VKVPETLAAFVRHVAVPTPGDSLESAYDLAVPSEKALLDLSGTNHSQWRREIAQVALWRAFVTMLPASVFEEPERPCRQQVEARVARVLGEPADTEIIDHIMTIVKRVQRVLLSGRRSISKTSFDVASTFHGALLKEQAHRCAVCGYEFAPADLEEDPSAGVLSRLDGRLAGRRDRSPTRIRRKAVLDHRLPIYIAGDDHANWQVLCTTCNEGKSDVVIAAGSHEWSGSLRSSRLTDVRSRLFYLILARDGACYACRRTPRQVELRVVRRDHAATDTYMNLTAACRRIVESGQCT
jgi:hypothetical protein